MPLFIVFSDSFAKISDMSFDQVWLRERDDMLRLIKRPLRLFCRMFCLSRKSLASEMHTAGGLIRSVLTGMRTSSLFSTW